MKLKKPSAAVTPLIGKMASVVSSGNRSLIGLSGIVVDETRDTLVIASQGRARRVQKAAAVIDVGGIRIDGKKLLRRPEDR